MDGTLSFYTGSAVFLSLDDLEPGKFLPFLFLQRLGDQPDGFIVARNHDVFQGIGTLLGFFDGKGQPINGIFQLGKLPHQLLDPSEFDQRIVKGGIGDAILLASDSIGKEVRMENNTGKLRHICKRGLCHCI